MKIHEFIKWEKELINIEGMIELGASPPYNHYYTSIFWQRSSLLTIAMRRKGEKVL